MWIDDRSIRFSSSYCLLEKLGCRRFSLWRLCPRDIESLPWLDPASNEPWHDWKIELVLLQRQSIDCRNTSEREKLTTLGEMMFPWISTGWTMAGFWKPATDRADRTRFLAPPWRPKAEEDAAKRVRRVAVTFMVLLCLLSDIELWLFVGDWIAVKRFLTGVKTTQVTVYRNPARARSGDGQTNDVIQSVGANSFLNGNHSSARLVTQSSIIHE